MDEARSETTQRYTLNYSQGQVPSFTISSSGVASDQILLSSSINAIEPGESNVMVPAGVDNQLFPSNAKPTVAKLPDTEGFRVAQMDFQSSSPVVTGPGYVFLDFAFWSPNGVTDHGFEVNIPLGPAISNVGRFVVERTLLTTSNVYIKAFARAIFSAVTKPFDIQVKVFCTPSPVWKAYGILRCSSVVQHVSLPFGLKTVDDFELVESEDKS